MDHIIRQQVPGLGATLNPKQQGLGSFWELLVAKSSIDSSKPEGLKSEPSSSTHVWLGKWDTYIQRDRYIGT